MAYWHVKVKTNYDNFKLKDGRKTNEMTFITEGATVCLRCSSDKCKHCARGAARKTLIECFGSIEIASYYIRGEPEVWIANKLRPSAR